MQKRRTRNKRLRLTDEEYIKNKIAIYNAKRSLDHIVVGNDGQAYYGTAEDVEQERENRTPRNFEYVYGGGGSRPRRRNTTHRQKHRRHRSRKA